MVDVGGGKYARCKLSTWLKESMLFEVGAGGSGGTQAEQRPVCLKTWTYR